MFQNREQMLLSENVLKRREISIVISLITSILYRSEIALIFCKWNKIHGKYLRIVVNTDKIDLLTKFAYDYYEVIVINRNLL